MNEEDLEKKLQDFYDDPRYEQYGLRRSEISFTNCFEEDFESKSKYIAYVMANRAEMAYEYDEFKIAAEMCLRCLDFDPFCIDAYGFMAKSTIDNYELCTTIELYHEIIYAARKIFPDRYFRYQVSFNPEDEDENVKRPDINELEMYFEVETRPYIRLFSGLGAIYQMNDDVNRAVYVYEEIIRLHRKDNEIDVKDYLVTAYLRVIGIRRNDPNSHNIVDRTFDHVDQLINEVIETGFVEWGGKLQTRYTYDRYKSPDESLVVRWYRIVHAFCAGNSYMHLVKQEES